MKTLCIGDAHADPRHNNKRFEALGNFIIEHKPDNIVQIGDWGSYDSVTFHTSGKPLLREGMRLADDIASAKDALYKAESPTIKYNEKQARNKKVQYKPNKWWLNGNHEERIFTNMMVYPELLGLIDHHDIVGASEYGWKVVPYRSYIEIDGIQFTHAPTGKRSPKPISGEYVAKRAIEIHDSTIVFGHTHRLVLHDKRTVGSEYPVYAINIGWFGDYVPEYIQTPQNLDWWSGLVMLDHYTHGQVGIETIPMEIIMNAYT